MTKHFLCPVCEFIMDFPPYDFNICPCCGTEFGYSDSGRSYEELRRDWLWHGAQWSSRIQQPPKGWNAISQLGTIKIEFGHAEPQWDPANLILVRAANY